MSEATSLRDLSPQQWKSGVAAWLGWLFDGLDMHLYTLVATPFVAELLGLQSDPTNEAVRACGSWIQAAFLVGWALGGGLFGWVGDRLGRSRTLVLTILTYACFTGLSYFAATWWQLLIFRFLAALGIGGEWAVGASLLSETWPRHWRSWIAAVLQSAYNVGVMIACVAGYAMASLEHRSVFLIGVLPALLVLWIRRAVKEPEIWQDARAHVIDRAPGLVDLFRGPVRRVTLLTIAVCSLSLTAHWAFMYWYVQYLRNLPDVATWSDAEKNQLASTALFVVMVASLVGNFLGGGVGKLLGYRRTIALGCVLYFGALMGAYGEPRPLSQLWSWLVAIGLCQGFFALFTMYLPPLFPTLLRTTGAGFSYNIGRIVAAAGTVFFGHFSRVGDHRLALLYAGFLFVPASLVALAMPDVRDDQPNEVPLEAIG